jgi:hypothetical protein
VILISLLVIEWFLFLLNPSLSSTHKHVWHGDGKICEFFRDMRTMENQFYCSLFLFRFCFVIPVLFWVGFSYMQQLCIHEHNKNFIYVSLARTRFCMLQNLLFLKRVNSLFLSIKYYNWPVQNIIVISSTSFEQNCDKSSARASSGIEKSACRKLFRSRNTKNLLGLKLNIFKLNIRLQHHTVFLQSSMSKHEK